DGQDDFEVDGGDLTNEFVEHGATVGLDVVFVEVEEGVGIEHDFFSRGGYRGRRRRGRSLGDDGAVAAGQAGFGRPEGIAPAQLAAAVHPGQAADVDPVALAFANVLCDDGRVGH